MKSPQDILHHFLFEYPFNIPMPIRGNVVHLNQSYQQALQHQTLPSLIKHALGELMAASALLSATLKMEGALVLQLQSKGALKLLVVECNQNYQLGLSLRATANWDKTDTQEIENHTLFELVKNGQFVITLDPTEGEAYQGIVPIEGETIAVMLQNYMLRSQQIDTSLWLQCDGASASGMLLQKLPALKESDADAWNRVNILANTVTNDELQNLAPERLLRRLFAEENVRLFEARPIQFKCNCSKTKVGNMLKLLGEDEVNSILTEQGNIDVNCDFCNKHYAFDAVDATALFASETMINISKSTH